MRLREVARRLRDELEVHRLVLRHPLTPRSAKIFLGLGLGYMLLPFDLIPDFIPVVGHLDDVVIVPLLFLAGIRRVPPAVMQECRERVRG